LDCAGGKLAARGGSLGSPNLGGNLIASSHWLLSPVGISLAGGQLPAAAGATPRSICAASSTPPFSEDSLGFKGGGGGAGLAESLQEKLGQNVIVLSSNKKFPFFPFKEQKYLEESRLTELLRPGLLKNGGTKVENHRTTLTL
jgi:hypothetical protein